MYIPGSITRNITSGTNAIYTVAYTFENQHTLDYPEARPTVQQKIRILCGERRVKLYNGNSDIGANKSMVYNMARVGELRVKYSV